MEFPPDNYFIFPAEHFENAVPRINGDYTVEILAQVRLTAGSWTTGERFWGVPKPWKRK